MSPSGRCGMGTLHAPAGLNCREHDDPFRKSPTAPGSLLGTAAQRHSAVRYQAPKNSCGNLARIAGGGSCVGCNPGGHPPCCSIYKIFIASACPGRSSGCCCDRLNSPPFLATHLIAPDAESPRLQYGAQPTAAIGAPAGGKGSFKMHAGCTDFGCSQIGLGCAGIT